MSRDDAPNLEVDILKTMCIEQGYVPKKCTLNGQLILILTAHGDPCSGCNENRIVCHVRIYNVE
jgi:hypothetical protein